MLSVLRRIAVCQVLGEQAGTLEEEAEVRSLAATLSPEECQLFYQLGLHGRRDLPLAPEPMVGFEMALLRMLAFRPDTSHTPGSVNPASAQLLPSAGTTGPDAARQAGRPPASSEVAVDVVARRPERPPAAREAAMPAIPVSTPVAAVTSPPPVTGGRAPTDLPLDWAATVAGLQASGLVREFARHCAFLHMEGDVIELSLTPQSENLRSERQVKGLEQALCQALGRTVILRFTREGSAHARTPAQALSEAEAARQAAATRQIENDPNVLALQRQFGATIERIEPTEP
jgi:DNA polymerase-3 subunit gamma/tau